jgi:hypothetical protein
MAPKATIENIASQMKRLLKSAHRMVGTSTEITISTPPMVGVPAFFW